ncbi:Agglutinin receptor [Folsomia candida]|uniref:Agglutinin receptor n=1 Tax=Folsomia candida TaxID=158441 RepID=A0A226DCT8_FOLCA|nr:Agglutinin receptor [Folsomia candida]
MDPLLPCLPDITYLSQQNRPYSIILMLTDEEELLLVSELRRLFKIGLHLTHLHLKQIFYVFATTVKPLRSNKFCHATSTSSPTKALSTPAADTIKLCLPSPPQPKILVRHMGHQLSPPRPPLPQIYPRILRHVPEFYLIPPLVVTPHVPSDIDHAIDSYTLPAWRNNVPILQRPRPLQFTTDISFLYTVDLLTSNPVEHPGVTPNFQKLDNQPRRTPRNHPEFQKFEYQPHRTPRSHPEFPKNLTTNPVEHPGITPNFKNLTTNPIEHPGVTPNFQKNLTTNPVEHPGITPNFKNLTTNPVEHHGVTPNFQKT